MTETNAPIIQLDKVRKSFGKQLVLDGVDLSVERGSTTVIIGPSGCGKSVLLKNMIGLLKPDQGRVFFDGKDITNLSERKMVPIRQRMGFLFQGAALFDSMSVEENIIFPLQEHGMGELPEQRERCSEVLALVGLDGVQDKYPEELSGGQKKRVALARAIVMRPEIIFYDEPTTGLDPVRSDLINELILRLQKVLHTTAVVVTHDMASARKIGDRILMLYTGRFIADTSPEHLDQVKNETVKRFIEGKASDEELRELDRGESRLNNGSRGPEENVA